MKYRLTLLILCFAFVANAQINFGVSVSNGFDRFVKPNIFKYSFSYPDIYLECGYGLKTKKISFQSGLGYTPFVLIYRNVSTNNETKFVQTSGESIDKISIPLNINYSFTSEESKVKFGISGGLIFEHLFSKLYFDKIKPDYQNGINGIIDNLNSTNAGGQLSFFSLFKKNSKISIQLNAGCSLTETVRTGYLYNNYSWGHHYKSEQYGLLNFFFKTSILFGK